MAKNLSPEEIFKVVRPVLGKHRKDICDIPVMKKVTEEMLDFQKIKPLNIQNLSIRNNNTDKIILSFSYDKYLARFWNDPSKYIPLFQSACAVGTLDYSLSEQMGFAEYLHTGAPTRFSGLSC